MDFVQQELDGVPQSTLIPATHLAALGCTLLVFFLKSSQDKFSLCCGAEMVDVPASHWSELRKKTKMT